MIDPSIITRGAERAQMQQQQNFESLGELGNSIGRMVLGRRINTLQQLGTPEEKQAYANKSIYAPQLNAQIKADQAAALQAQMVQQKHAADISETNSEAFKNNQQGSGFGLDNGQKQLGAINSAIQQASMTGDKTAAIIGLDAARRVGLISSDDYNQHYKVLNAMTPEEVKSYAQSVTFANAKDPASIVFQTANNVADNATSIANNTLTNQTSADNNIRSNQTAENNNIRTTDTTRYGTDVNANIAQQKMTLDQAKLEHEQKKGTVQQFGDSLYMVYPNGSAVPINSPTGQPVTKNNVTLKNSIAEEQQRTQKVAVTLDEIEKKLPEATSSGLGKGVDYVARFFGKATDGDVATAQLGTLGGQLVALMPKMSGPQSDKDVEMYKQMAGKLDDASIPIEMRKAALQTIRDLNTKYSQMNETRGQGVPYANASSGAKPNALDFFK